MRFMLRYGLAALALLAVAIVAISPFASTFIEQWSRRDIELRSMLVFNSVRDELTGLLELDAKARIDELFDRLTLDERLHAVGFCDQAGNLRFRSKLLPATFSCPRATGGAGFSTVVLGGQPFVTGSFPVLSGNTRGHLVLLHDLTFAEQRGAQARIWIVVALTVVALVGAAIASTIALLMVRRWLRAANRVLEEAKVGRDGATGSLDVPVFGRQTRHLLRQLDEARRFVDAHHVDWGPDTLRQALAAELPHTEVIVVSNREPYIHNYGSNGIELQIPASGLVAAIEPVMRACGGTWVAHGSGSADRDVVDARDRVRVPPAAPSYTLRRVWLSESEQDGYYYGLANEGLWPLCHLAFVRPTFRAADWAEYRAVNERFAEAVVAEAESSDPLILVQDYHLALLPRMIRERLPQATIVAFWHIPWPNPETFGICPWKDAIVEGLLGSSVLGFHTQFHCNNFLDTVDRFVESRIDREHASITVSGHETFVRPYPISIEWPPAGLAGQKPVAECRASVRTRLGLSDETRLGVGIERFDYTKGILDRLRAVDDFLSRHPEWQGRFVFLQVAAPTRGKLATYRHFEEEVEGLVRDINGRHGRQGYLPVLLEVRHCEPSEVFELFRAADLCVVSSLHDGMNLVAKEFVAARDDERGVLILSSFAGASRELSEALIVNPYDVHATSEAIGRALRMPDVEQRERMRLMREIVRSRNVYRWAGQMLLDAAQLRKRQKIMLMGSQESGGTLIKGRFKRAKVG